MGKTWGNLAKIRGVVFFRLSPHEQKAFGGMVSKGLPNMYRRFKEEVLWVTARKLKHFSMTISSVCKIEFETTKD